MLSRTDGELRKKEEEKEEKAAEVGDGGGGEGVGGCKLGTA